MLIEIGQLALSAITLLLQRLDRRREDVRQSSDLQSALLVLSESLGRWADAAEKTNLELSGEMAFSQMAVSQRVHGWLAAEGSGDVASAQATLATYAPELREQLGQVAATRTQQINEILRLVEQTSSDVPRSIRADLDASATALQQAKRELDAFIRATFPQPPAPSEPR